jgi:hypothetical protein
MSPKIIYNVTLNVDDSVHQEWLDWMRNIHIPEVLQTGLFTDHRLLKMISEEDTGTTYAVQYMLDDIKHFLTYSEKFAPALRQKVLDKFGEKVLAFRTLMEIVE